VLEPPRQEPEVLQPTDTRLPLAAQCKLLALLSLKALAESGCLAPARRAPAGPGGINPLALLACELVAPGAAAVQALLAMQAHGQQVRAGRRGLPGTRQGRLPSTVRGWMPGGAPAGAEGGRTLGAPLRQPPRPPAPALQACLDRPVAQRLVRFQKQLVLDYLVRDSPELLTPATTASSPRPPEARAPRRAPVFQRCATRRQAPAGARPPTRPWATCRAGV
jgi:hypothetical protein